MIVCATCKKEMSCKKTGSSIRFNNGHHTYPADQFECTKCGAVVNVSSGKSYYCPSPVKDNHDVWMD